MDVLTLLKDKGIIDDQAVAAVKEEISKRVQTLE